MKKIVILILFLMGLFAAITITGSIRSVMAIDCSKCAYGCNNAGTACRGAPGFCPQGYHYDTNANDCVINTGGGGGGGGGTTYKCTCTDAYGACGSYLGHSNIKIRTCNFSSTGTSTCYLVEGTYFNYTSCPAPGTTISPGTTPGTCPTYSGCSNDHKGYRYSYSPSCTTCSLGCEGHWPVYPGDFTLDASCGVAGGATSTPIPPANCSYRWFCMKTTGKCEETNRSYYDTTAGGVTLNGQCGGGPTCEQNLPTYHGSLPGGKCYKDTPADKNACQAACKIDCPKLAEGDADCDGKVTLKDYFYYVSKKANANIRAAINVDFNTDKKVDDADRAIVVKTLKP